MKLVYYTHLDKSTVGVLDGDKIFYIDGGTRYSIKTSEAEYAVIPVDRITETDVDFATEIMGDHIEFFILKVLIQEIKDIKGHLIESQNKDDKNLEKQVKELTKALSKFADPCNWGYSTEGLLPREKWICKDPDVHSPKAYAQKVLNKWGYK